MGTLFVVASQPSIGLRLNLTDRIEQTRIEHLGAKASVEAFDEGSLVGLAGLDERQPDTLIPGLVHKGMRGHLRAAVQPDGLRLAIDLHEFLHHPCQPQRQDGVATFDVPPLPAAFINDVERVKWPAVVERVTYEIQRPDRVEHLHGLHLPLSRQHVFDGSVLQHQARIRVLNWAFSVSSPLARFSSGTVMPA